MNARHAAPGAERRAAGCLLLGAPAHGGGVAFVRDRTGRVVLAHVELPLAGDLRPRAVDLAAGRAAVDVERPVGVVGAVWAERGLELALLQRDVPVVVRLEAVAAAGALEREP